jgi:hypothetical protein
MGLVNGAIGTAVGIVLDPSGTYTYHTYHP